MTYHDVVSLMGPRDDGNITDEQRAATTDPAETNSVPLDEAMQEDIAPSSIIPRGPSFLAMKRMQTEIRRKKKRLHQLVPEAYVSLVKHDEGVHGGRNIISAVVALNCNDAGFCPTKSLARQSQRRFLLFRWWISDIVNCTRWQKRVKGTRHGRCLSFSTS